jgi:hypothetical protein
VSELLQNLTGGQLLGLVAMLLSFLVGGAVALTAIVTAHWRKARQAEREAALKHEMLQRGMSAEEIVLVISATRGSSVNADSPARA